MRTFGGFVQGLREHAGLSREEFGSLVHLSKHSVASIELGRRLADERFVELAESALGNTGALRKAFTNVARQQGFAAWFRMWARLEREAVVLDTYECRLVPGLLQTPGYVRALYDNEVPPLSDEKMDGHLAARLERQRLLRERPTTQFSFIVEEVVLRRRIGGEEVVREQYDHILEATAPRNITFQIMPLEAARHACLAGPLQLLVTPGGNRYAYCEGQENGRMINDQKEVIRFQQRYATLRSQALTPEDSVSLLKRLRGAL
ncbi:helix-turn-helix transcriptional regulator [Streptomyces sp. A012304]|uniref:helix-turn-helix domain-containing protein n=1 Tax=Streptomyces sp. A012304 TaxID=375446 RepID=UPI002231E3BC|nr:helix-turn-helix transcriptional regulator [Streptomyces sp. A012304]